ncbi:MAG: hypothetical protein B6U69_03095 [Thermofilum sp. ex4484_15]|nr:MAG: hypothetical protein B6U69_03095 [Thermofilum sp. ex4484_15]
MLSLLELAILTSLTAGSLCGAVGFHAFKMGVITLSFAVAHGALAGAAIGLVLRVDVSYSALIAAILTATTLSLSLSKLGPFRELINMVFFSTSSAIALLSIYYANVKVLATTNVAALLWGSVLTVTPFKYFLLLSTALSYLAYYLAFKWKINSIIYDRRLAEAEGINVTLHTSLLLTFEGLSIALTLMLVGGFLVFSLLYNPVIASSNLTKETKGQLLLSTTLGGFSSLMGLAISYLFDSPVGASIALSSATLVIASYFLKFLKNRLNQYLLSGNRNP